MSKGLWLITRKTHHSSWCGQDTLFTRSTPSHWCWDRMLASKRSRLYSRRCPAGSFARTLMLQKAQMPATESKNESLPGTWCVVVATADECEMKHFCILFCEFHIQDTTCKLCRMITEQWMWIQRLHWPVLGIITCGTLVWTGSCTHGKRHSRTMFILWSDSSKRVSKCNGNHVNSHDPNLTVQDTCTQNDTACRAC